VVPFFDKNPCRVGGYGLAPFLNQSTISAVRPDIVNVPTPPHDQFTERLFGDYKSFIMGCQSAIIITLSLFWKDL
jgi:hypothetical protein